MTVDWHDVPRGFYALRVIDVLDDAGDYPTLGYKMFQRRAPRTYKSGRTVGRNRWIRSYALADGFTWERFRENCPEDNELSRRSDIDDILYEPQRAQAEFGRFTGRCGCCGRTLSDPNSKMRGIGPECAGLR
jgi:hypothetical protein